MGRALSGLVLFIFLFSCGKRLPEGVAPAAVMSDLLFDIHLMDSKMSNYQYDSAKVYFEPAYAQIFKKYNLDSTSFRQTMEYYTTRPTELLGFYKTVNERIQANITLGQKRVEEEARERRLQDSLYVLRMKDSLAHVARLVKQRDRIQHLLFLHESDSTLDEAVPFTYRDYARQIEEDLGVWRIRFLDLDSVRAASLRADSIRAGLLLNDRLQADSLRRDSLNGDAG